MAKRVFEIAKELTVKSKAIVEKCKAEDIPNIQNHMSSVSAGLEATIRQWFSTVEEASTTAIETAEKVDIEKVRVQPKKKARATKAAAGSDATFDQGGDTATAVAEPPVAEPVVNKTKAAPIKPSSAPPSDEPGEQPSPKAPEAEQEGTTPKVEVPKKAPVGPVMNVPKRPDVVKPAGPKLHEVQKPAKLFGPKVVRVEAPERIEPPRQRRPAASDPGVPMNRRPRGGGGAGAGAGSPGVPLLDDRTSRRNKRRGPGRTDQTQQQQQQQQQPQKRTGRTGGEVKTWREQDLIERQARLSRSGGFLRQRRRDQKLKSQGSHERAPTLAETGGKVKVSMPLSIKELSSATGVKASEIVKKLFMQGITATVNSAIDSEHAQEIMLEYEIELEVVALKSAADVVEERFGERETIDERPRAPVITILGHVDHGKTSLLDRIRNANVAEKEAGGITQATSAFRVPVHVGDNKRDVCFLDTPGHAAFSEMRSRGANLTDIVVLVVAASEGVMPQTIESINHAKAAGVPVVVALNKIDMPNSTDEQIQMVLGQLAEHGLNPVEWGGETEVVRTSATTGHGVQELLEVLEYQADLRDLKGDFSGEARGVVIEAKLAEGRGPTAVVLIQEGELKIGDTLVTGRAFGRVRDMTDDHGKRIKSAGPSTPVTISGIDKLPDAGDKFFVVQSIKQAQEAADHVEQTERERELTQPKVTLDAMFAQLEEAELKELLIVLKADVQGSVDVIKTSIEEISGDEIKVRVLHAAAGGITESDITLASASGAVVMGFNVIASHSARRLAEAKHIEVRAYQVIYDIVDDVKKAAEGLLEPEIRQEVLGHAEVRQVFKVSKVGSIAGCYVTDGKIERNALIRVTRDDIVIEQGRKLEQLKRFKDDAKEVRSGQECGMKIVGYDDIKEGDVLECYTQIEVKRTLS